MWIFNSLCELLFLDKLVKGLSWNADTTVKKPFIDSTTILVVCGCNRDRLNYGTNVMYVCVCGVVYVHMSVCVCVCVWRM